MLRTWRQRITFADIVIWSIGMVILAVVVVAWNVRLRG